MDRFHAITTFIKVVEAGSFVGAAERLAVSVSSVSRVVADLEAHLGTRLLNRTTRRLSLTEAGRRFHEHGVQLLADLDEAEASASAEAMVPRGTLRVTCGTTFGNAHLATAIAAFMAKYPEVRFDVELSDRMSDLVDEGFDVAVRIGGSPASNLVGRRVGSTALVCCAAPSYLAVHGEPGVPDDLAQHRCLLYQYAAQRDVWTFTDAKGETARVRVSGPLVADNGSFLAALAREGAGIACEPDFVVGPDVRAGRLVPILRTFQPPSAPIHVVYPSRRHLSAKVRVFAQFLVERFAVPEWVLGNDVARRPPRGARSDAVRRSTGRHKQG
ncbi:MAG: LysR family transcriptional regulator [Burkholderiales bacterium]|nr:LysR family transcriptional regulator [Burkholderiales bacterium]